MYCKLDTNLSLNEKKKLQKFLKEHAKMCNDVSECSNHSFIYSSNSGIGTKIEVKCKHCDKKQDITDYAEW